MGTFIGNKQGAIHLLSQMADSGDNAFFQDKISQLESLRKKLQDNLESSLGLGIKVTLVEPKKIGRSEGKVQRVIDKRKF